MSTKVQLFFNEVSFTLRNRSKLKQFIPTIFKAEKKSLITLSYIFCTDDYLLGVNRQFLQHDYYTDIITFDLSDKNGPVHGEIYISVNRVRENAQYNKTTMYDEMHRVIFHGVLHLCGYKDKTKREITKMREREAFYLNKYSGIVKSG